MSFGSERFRHAAIWCGSRHGDTLTNRVIATVPIGQAPQALTYVPDAVPTGTGIRNIQPLGLAGQVAHLTLAASAKDTGKVPTSVSSFDQGLVQVLEASVTARPGSAIVKKYAGIALKFDFKQRRSGPDAIPASVCLGWRSKGTSHLTATPALNRRS